MKNYAAWNMLKRKLLNTWLPGVAMMILATILSS